MTEAPPHPHFTLEELCHSEKATELRISNAPGPAAMAALQSTMQGLERVRAFLDRPMKILSGFRCEELNTKVGGESKKIGSKHDSQHMKGEAADFICPGGPSPIVIVTMLAPRMLELGIDQLILEPTWVHVSFAPNPRNEVLTKLMSRKGYAKGIVIKG